MKLGCVLGHLLCKAVINGLDGGVEAGERSKCKLIQVIHEHGDSKEPWRVPKVLYGWVPR